MKDLFSGLFLGPKGENTDILKELSNKVIDFQSIWRKSFYPLDKSLLETRGVEYYQELQKYLDILLDRSKKSYPYFHPRYSAQMLKDPPIPTIIGHLAFMLSNPNNHAYEGGPVTTEMEMEVTDTLLKLVGYKSGWGHLASGGSLANTEALWAIRDYYKTGKCVYFSEVSHYSWKRICNILAISNFKLINVDKNLRLDLNHLEENLKINPALVVIANFGSTGAGSIDDLEGLVYLKERYNFHLHVDAAYGGFTRSIILDENYKELTDKDLPFLGEHLTKQLKMIPFSDSLTIDPHKQGLISYGAGAVLYQNTALREVVLSTAPYTYHQLDKPNIGMFSLEGSRPGAMAAACWLTYKVIPPNNTGIGKIISAQIDSSRKLYELIEKSSVYTNLNNPDIDINCFYSGKDLFDVAKINESTIPVYNAFSVEAENPPFILSKFVLTPDLVERILPQIKNEKKENLIVLRSVNLKHWQYCDDFRYIRELISELESFHIKRNNL